MATPDGNNTTVIDTQQGGDPLAGVKAVAGELKQNIGDLASAVCELEGVIKGELLNDIAVAVQEIKQFDITLAKADTDFENFLKKLEEFNLEKPGGENQQHGSTGVKHEKGKGESKQEGSGDDALDNFQDVLHAIDIYKDRNEIREALKEAYDFIKNFRGNSFKGAPDFEFPVEQGYPGQLYQTPESGYWGNNVDFNEEPGNFLRNEENGYDIFKGYSENEGMSQEQFQQTFKDFDMFGGPESDMAGASSEYAATAGTDALIADGGEVVAGSLLADAEWGAIFGPEGMLAGLIIGGLYELGKSLLSSDEVNPSQLVYKDGTPLFNPLENKDGQPQSGVNNFYGGGSNVMGYSDDGGVTMQILHRNNAGNSGIVWGENSDYGSDINSNSGASNNTYASTNTSTNSNANNPPAKAAPGSGGIITTIPGQTGAGGYSASGGESIDWEHPVLPQIYINPDIQPRKQTANPNSAYAPDAALVKKPFQLLSQFSNSVRHVNQQSKCVTINVNIKTNADIHNNTFHSASSTDKDIQNKIMEVLMAAISDSKVSAATH